MARNRTTPTTSMPPIVGVPGLAVVRLGSVGADLLPVAEALQEADVDRRQEHHPDEGEQQRDDDRR